MRCYANAVRVAGRGWLKGVPASGERKARFFRAFILRRRLQVSLLQLRRGYDGSVRDPTTGRNLNQKRYIRCITGRRDGANVTKKEGFALQTERHRGRTDGDGGRAAG